MFTDLIYEYGVYLLLIAVIGYLVWNYRRQLFKNVAGKKGLDFFTNDLTLKAQEEKLDPIIGRQDEIDQVIRILSRRTKNNPVLTGPAGVGKTAVVEGLALRMVTDDVPDTLTGKRILALDLAKVISGTKYRGELEERFKQIIDEVVAAERQVILFIDEIHMLMQTKGVEGAMNMTDIIKPLLARGDLQLIGATTTKEYEEYLAIDEALARRFRTVLVNEPSSAETKQILEGIKKKYEEYHRVKFSDDSLKTIIKLASKYIKNRKFPDKAIDLIDESGARVNISSRETPDDSVDLMHVAAKHVKLKVKKAPKYLRNLKKQLNSLKKQRAIFEKEDNQLEVEKVREEMLIVTKEIQDLEKDYQSAKYENKWPEVRPEHIKKIVREWTGKRF